MTLACLSALAMPGPLQAARPVLRVGEFDPKRQRQIYGEFLRQESARVQDVRFRVVRDLGEGRYAVSLTAGDDPDAIVVNGGAAGFESGKMARGLLYPEGTEMMHLLRHLPAFRLLQPLDPETRRRDRDRERQVAERAVRALAAETSFEEWMESLRRGGVTQLTFTKEERCRDCAGWGKVTLPDAAARREGAAHKGKPGPDGKVACGVCKGRGSLSREVVYSLRY
ncbi:MAG TPA: hypothetical protein VMN36_15400 [Verrucomicrobiales bacterium]|nr:hypothetical protein [Verrucomicrobiales bacterium]